MKVRVVTTLSFNTRIVAPPELRQVENCIELLEHLPAIGWHEEKPVCRIALSSGGSPGSDIQEGELPTFSYSKANFAKNLKIVLLEIPARIAVDRLVATGGSWIARELLAQNLVDEIEVTLHPAILSSSEAPTLLQLDSELVPEFLPSSTRFKLAINTQLSTTFPQLLYLRER
jgi:riboflavin biosynthesis pyrimidine reductase